MEPEEVPYGPWREQYCAKEEDLARQKNHKFSYCPKISVVVPAYRTPEIFLRQMIESLEKQSYENWELVIGNASPEDETMARILKEYTGKDPRVKNVPIPENIGIAENTNAALAAAAGNFVGFMDHDDLLAPDALFEIAIRLEKDPSIDAFYTDEDKVRTDLSEYFQPHFKPDFNLDLLRSNNYICHFSMFDADLLKKTGLFRSEYDGSQDHDMVLRLTERAEKIVHVPKVLYYWRMHNNSVAQNLDSKSYAVDAAIRAVSGQLVREHESGKVGSSLPFRTIYKVDYDIINTPLVSIVVHNCKSEKQIKDTVERIFEVTDYKNIEIIYLFNKTCKTIQIKLENNSKVKWIECKNYSDAEEWNLGVQSAHGEYIVLMDVKCRPANSRWLDEMLMFAQREDVVTVGPKIYYRDRSVAYAGIALSKKKKSGLYWLCQYNTIDEIGYEGMLCHARDTSASMAGCMMFKKKNWEENQKFDSCMGKLADIDFCLKGSRNHKLNVWTSYSEILYTGENLIPETGDSEISAFKNEWKEEIVKETYCHPMWEKLGLV